MPAKSLDDLVEQSEIDSPFTIISSDGIEFNCSRAMAKQSSFIAVAMKMDDKSTSISVDVKSSVLAKVVEYMKFHEICRAPDELPKPLPSTNMKIVLSTYNYKGWEWDLAFIRSYKLTDDLVDLIYCANYMLITPLLQLACAYMGIFIKPPADAPADVTTSVQAKKLVSQKDLPAEYPADPDEKSDNEDDDEDDDDEKTSEDEKSEDEKSDNEDDDDEKTSEDEKSEDDEDEKSA
jgi:hypothetical protein